VTTNIRHGSEFALVDESYKVDHVPGHPEGAPDLFSGDVDRRTELDDYPGHSRPAPKRAIGFPNMPLFNAKMDGLSETKAMHPGYIKEQAISLR